jgi:type VI secretion system protein ImpK
MTLLELCDPLFQYICRINRMARAGADLSGGQIRAEIQSILSQIRSTAAQHPGMLGLFEMKEDREGKKGIELVLIFFADFMIRESNLPCSRGWNDIATDYEEYAGDDKFFELLDQTLEDQSPQATEQLTIFYTCMGMGFTGGYAGQESIIDRKMRDCAARIRDFMDTSDAERICGDAYKCTDRRELNLPATGRVTQYVVTFALILFSVFVLAGVAYHVTKSDLSKALEGIKTQVSSHGDSR